VITWYAAYTQPHAEMKAVAHLARQGYITYLPRCRRWCRHARKRSLVLRPLFPRYLFVGLDPLRQGCRPIRSTVGVIGLVSSGDLPVVVASEIVESIRQREAEGAFDLSAPAQRLRSGDLVRVTEGPFENMLGRLLALADDQRVYVLLELLGRSVRTEFAAAAIEAA
jgi:transcriptional antiterminator RfaH